MTILFLKNLGTKFDRIELKSQGSKNAALPLLIAKALVPGITLFKNVPNDLKDVRELISLMKNVGLGINKNEQDLEISNTHKLRTSVSYNKTKKIRYSSLLVGALIHTKMNIKIGKPGGCQLGGRPIDFHIEGLKAAGYDCKNNKNFITVAQSEQKTITNNLSYTLPFPSVGATLNLVFSCVIGDRIFTINNVAIEPEIINVIDFLNRAGAKIDLEGRTIKVTGVKALQPVSEWTIPFDRIACTTYICLGILLNKEIHYHNICADEISSFLSVIKNMDVQFCLKNDGKTIILNKQNIEQLKTTNLIFEPHPGTATDIHPMLALLSSQISGTTRIQDKVFSKRYLTYLEALARSMSQNSTLKGDVFIINGPISFENLPFKLRCNDIRSGMSCIAAAAYSKKSHLITNVDQVLRGYSELKIILKKFGILCISV